MTTGVVNMGGCYYSNFTIFFSLPHIFWHEIMMLYKLCFLCAESFEKNLAEEVLFSFSKTDPGKRTNRYHYCI